MLGQVMLGSFMHTWDCLSDCYVVYLWHVAGRNGLFAAGMLFMVASPLLTGLQAFGLVGRLGYGRRMQLVCVLLLPLNAHRRVFSSGSRAAGSSVSPAGRAPERASRQPQKCAFVSAASGARSMSPPEGVNGPAA